MLQDYHLKPARMNSILVVQWIKLNNKQTTKLVEKGLNTTRIWGATPTMPPVQMFALEHFGVFDSGIFV